MTIKRIKYDRYGGPEVMRLASFEPSSPGHDEVLVQVKFAAINPIDWKLRNGVMKIVTGRKFPRGMGMDFSGVVIAVGSRVTRFEPGMHVFGLAPFKQSGALAQQVVTKEALLAQKPAGLSFEQAACLGTPATTAWNGLVDKAELVEGRQVFINGCAGAVGEAAVQIATMFGAHVSGSCSAWDVCHVSEIGVEAAYDYRTTDLTQIPERFDVVFDTAATMDIATGRSLLHPGGVFVDLNPSPGKFLRAMWDRRLKLVVATPRPSILERIGLEAEAGRFRTTVGKIVPLTDAVALITELERGAKVGGKGLVAMG